MTRERDEMGAVIKYEVQKGMEDTIFHTFMTKEGACGSERTFVRAVFEPGTSTGVYEYQGGFEGYYVLKGWVPATDNDVESMLSPRNCHMYKDEGSHGIAYYGDEIMEIITLITSVPAQRCRGRYFEWDIGPGCLF